MTSLADRTIDALRTNHDVLARAVPDLSDEQLGAPSGASEWTVAQVLSHLGSGAEIGLAGYVAAFDGTEAPGPDFNQSVWDRWNAQSPREQAGGFLEADRALVEALEALSSDRRESVEVKLGFLPAPLPLASVAGMRLNETTQHGWDVRVGLDPAATLDPAGAEVVVEHYEGGLGFLLAFLGKADRLAEPAVVAVDGTDVAVVIADGVSLTRSGAPTARLTGGYDALVRLLGGRLRAPYTADGVAVTGNVTLDQLREVFPGY